MNDVEIYFCFTFGKYLQYLENLEDLSTLVRYTNDVKNMSADMDRIVREACDNSRIKKKVKFQISSFYM